MQRPMPALSIVRVACGCFQALLGGATIVAVALLARHSGALADGSPVLMAVMIAAGAATLLQGIVAIATAALARLPRASLRS
jgi:predicted phage tail protein